MSTLDMARVKALIVLKSVLGRLFCWPTLITRHAKQWLLVLAPLYLSSASVSSNFMALYKCCYCYYYYYYYYITS